MTTETTAHAAAMNAVTVPREAMERSWRGDEGFAVPTDVAAALDTRVDALRALADEADVMASASAIEAAATASLLRTVQGFRFDRAAFDELVEFIDRMP